MTQIGLIFADYWWRQDDTGWTDLHGLILTVTGLTRDLILVDAHFWFHIRISANQSNLRHLRAISLLLTHEKNRTHWNCGEKLVNRYSAIRKLAEC